MAGPYEFSLEPLSYGHLSNLTRPLRDLPAVKSARDHSIKLVFSFLATGIFFSWTYFGRPPA